ncbi:MAG TPA: M20/M25/M40 family metallo-hydrolase [Pseudolabrys sp.]|nr:M20/M25/M40 family metallo-hydrolase [Pseudolabrys sp.]
MSETGSVASISADSGKHLSRDALVDNLKRFVAYPSEQSALHERDPAVLGFIKECAAPLLDQMQATYRYDDMGNLILEAGPKGTGRGILFVGYAMTHPGAAMTDPFSPTLIATPRGEALRGRGVAEQKTALAALFGAVGEALAGSELEGRLIVTLVTAGETGRHDAVDSVMKQLDETPNCTVVCIGTDNRVAVSNKGRIDFDIIVGGKAAHSSVPAQGINAIIGAQRILKTLDGIEIGVPEHPVFGQATLTPTAIDSSPKATHTVPDKVRITFDRRLLPGEDPETAFKAITAKFSLEKPWSLAFERGPVMYPNELALDGPFFAKLRAAFGAAGQGEPKTFACNFALDAGYFSRSGIEAVMLGPGEVDQFHSSEEQVLVSDLIAMANVYYQLIRRCVGPDR